MKVFADAADLELQIDMLEGFDANSDDKYNTQMICWLKELQRRRANETVTAWIKCSERMPDESQPVITVADGGVIQRTVYQFCDGVWSDWYDQYGDVKADAFTHWMPLPAAPGLEM